MHSFHCYNTLTLNKPTAAPQSKKLVLQISTKATSHYSHDGLREPINGKYFYNTEDIDKF